MVVSLGQAGEEEDDDDDPARGICSNEPIAGPFLAAARGAISPFLPPFSASVNPKGRRESCTR